MYESFFILVGLIIDICGASLIISPLLSFKRLRDEHFLFRYHKRKENINAEESINNLKQDIEKIYDQLFSMQYKEIITTKRLWIGSSFLIIGFILQSIGIISNII